MDKDFKMDTRIDWFHGFKRVLYEHKPMNHIGEDEDDIKTPTSSPITDLPEPIHSPVSLPQRNYPITQWKESSMFLNEDRIPLLSEKHLKQIPESCMKYVNDLRARIMKLERENTDLSLYTEDADNEYAMLLRETKLLRTENAMLKEELKFQKNVFIESLRYKGSDGRVTRVNKFRFGEPLTDELPPTLDDELRDLVDERLQVIDRTQTPEFESEDRYLKDRNKLSIETLPKGEPKNNLSVSTTAKPNSSLPIAHKSVSEPRDNSNVKYMEPSTSKQNTIRPSKLPRALSRSNLSSGYQIEKSRKISNKKPEDISARLELTSQKSKIPVRIKSSVPTTSIYANDSRNSSTLGTSKSYNQSNHSKHLTKKFQVKPKATYQLPPLKIKPGDLREQPPSKNIQASSQLCSLPFPKEQSSLRDIDFSVPKIKQDNTSAQRTSLPKIKTISTGDMDKSRTKLYQKIKAEPLPNRLKGAPKLPKI